MPKTARDRRARVARAAEDAPVVPVRLHFLGADRSLVGCKDADLHALPRQGDYVRFDEDGEREWRHAVLAVYHNLSPDLSAYSSRGWRIDVVLDVGEYVGEGDASAPTPGSVSEPAHVDPPEHPEGDVTDAVAN
ncbi:MAG TPA: hypothetical protein EYQ24_16625 [Bacteroidetes bacterium]|nr:hypothetical protein [Bacteroidota bacterium]